MNGAREIRLDFLRIVAIFGFFLCAVSNRTLCNSTFPDVGSLSSLVFMCIGSFCLPLLFMLTGNTLLDPKHDFTFKKHFMRMLRILTAGAVWTCAYTAVLFLAMNYKFDVKRFIYVAYSSLPHMRYVLAFLCVYLTVPIYRLLVKNKRATEYFLVLAFIFASFLPMLRNFPVVYRASYISSSLDINMFCGLSWLMVLGYYLRAYPPKLGLRVTLYSLSAVSVILSIICLTSGHNLLDQSMFVISANFVLYAAGIYVLFTNKATRLNRNDKLERFVTPVSKCSLGTFIMSLFFIKALSILGLNGASFMPWLAIPTTAIVSCITAYGFAYIISGIPVVNRWLM
ncbi:MAG: hypothetical protein PHT58_04855 [Eubacteriales bacterium]|nr:hypothetical protein [Eubacteriales bacterium]